MSLRSTCIFISIFSLLTIDAQQVLAQIDSCQVMVEQINNALNSNQTDKIYAYFNQKIELSVPGQAGINSSDHAQMILKSFFRDNPPTSFYVVSKNFGQQSVFIIGTLITEKQRYRLSYLINKNQKHQLIYQLSIEK